MHQGLHLVPVGIHFRDESLAKLLQALLEHGIRALELSFFRGQSSFRRNHLKIRAADRKHDQFTSIQRRIAIRVRSVFRGTVVVKCGEIENGLRKMGAEINIVKGTDDRGDRKPRKIESDPSREFRIV